MKIKKTEKNTLIKTPKLIIIILQKKIKQFKTVLITNNNKINLNPPALHFTNQPFSLTLQSLPPPPNYHKHPLPPPL